jgi:hypothetical protein
MKPAPDALALLALAAALAAPGSARADDPFAWLPGSSRAIPRTTSASRDAPVSALVFGPRVGAVAAVDFAVARIPFAGLALRPGVYAMFALEHADPGVHGVLPLPGQGQGPMLWRGLYGFSLALSAERLARRTFGERGALEITMTFGHESDHFTGGDFEDVRRPGDLIEGAGGNHVLFDLAARFPLGRYLDLWIRPEDRVYVAGPLLHAPGLDLGVRVRAHSLLQPIVSVFGEGLLADANQNHANHGFFAALLAGLAIVGRYGEVTPFVSGDVGNGKGLLVNRRELRVGGGIRYAPF